ncbi:E3 ubiquitin ligase BIG BROTHER-related [Neltuma alba]|uniref:E3 ubiquitin ligase BIG BROTHER-related n=1 Tax=Neltuma alba TaxID=207710 RepID=UPI0010A342A2|nr:E3 ubiquitin ligase BIG BROTHER-related-like [Prosopis alba]
MGSTNSRLRSRPSTSRVNGTNRFRFSSLLCGGSAARSTYEMEDQPSELQRDSATEFNDENQKVVEESSISCTEARIGCRPHTETASSSDTRTELSEISTVEVSSRSVSTSCQTKYLSESKELVPPHQVSAVHSYDEPYRDSSNTASTSFVEQQSSDPVSVNVSANKDAVGSVDSGVSQISRETMYPRSSTSHDQGDSNADNISIENHTHSAVPIHNSELDHVAQVSNLPVTSELPENATHQETIPSGLGFLVSNRERGQGNDSMFQVDVVAISSNVLSDGNVGVSDRDARRDSRRLFWDAFSRRSSRRFGDSRTFVFSAGDVDDPSSQDQWLLDLSNNSSNDGVGNDSGYLGSRIHRLNERMRHSRSEIWERLRGGLDEIGRLNPSCPLGLHPDGMCSCESFQMAEESSTRASISRIAMLAEALFEVLDEIHRQPVSLALSMVSLPAPESIVDSFPLKCHKKIDTSDNGNDAEQCYICLAEYEEGDKIRVLPCNHEYHMSCVDKWLKEIHGVCPLCRGNVCGGSNESPASNAEVPSQ